MFLALHTTSSYGEHESYVTLDMCPSPPLRPNINPSQQLCFNVPIAMAWPMEDMARSSRIQPFCLSKQMDCGGKPLRTDSDTNNGYRFTANFRIVCQLTLIRGHCMFCGSCLVMFHYK